MKLEEKTKKKDEQGLIIKKYQQYLKLEKSLSKNTLEAYLTDLEKLLSFLSAEGVEILEVSLLLIFVRLYKTINASAPAQTIKIKTTLSKLSI